MDAAPEARFNIDSGTCKTCTGYVKSTGCIEAPVMIEKLLTHLDGKDASVVAGNGRFWDRIG